MHVQRSRILCRPEKHHEPIWNNYDLLYNLLYNYTIYYTIIQYIIQYYTVGYKFYSSSHRL